MIGEKNIATGSRLDYVKKLTAYRCQVDFWNSCHKVFN